MSFRGGVELRGVSDTFDPNGFAPGAPSNDDVNQSGDACHSTEPSAQGAAVRAAEQAHQLASASYALEYIANGSASDASLQRLRRAADSYRRTLGSDGPKGQLASLRRS